MCSYFSRSAAVIIFVLHSCGGLFECFSWPACSLLWRERNGDSGHRHITIAAIIHLDLIDGYPNNRLTNWAPLKRRKSLFEYLRRRCHVTLPVSAGSSSSL
jgi:hypothetical protein